MFNRNRRKAGCIFVHNLRFEQFLFEHFVYFFKGKVLSLKAFSLDMLNECIMFSNFKTIV